MDYKTTPPPGWETRTPETWANEAHHAQAMGRFALHHAPELVGMFAAWSTAWTARAREYATWTERAQEHASDAVADTVAGRREDARRSFAHAVAAAERAAAVLYVSYRSYLETIPNPE